jgi:hypothetical protein
MGLLPSAGNESGFENPGNAMLLAKVDDHYERVGIFKLCEGWIWNDQGNLQRIEKRGDFGVIFKGQNSARQTFWLG